MISRPETSGPAASPRAAPRRNAVAGLALAALVLAGCGGGSSLVADGTNVAPPGTVPVNPSPDPAGSLPATGPAAPADPAAAAPTSPGTPAPPPPSGPNGALPSLPVYDVATGMKVDLARVPPPDRPMLVWFWAPH